MMAKSESEARLQAAAALHPREAITFPNGYHARGTVIEGKYIDVTGGVWDGVSFIGCHLALYDSLHDTSMEGASFHDCMLAGELWNEIIARYGVGVQGLSHVDKFGDEYRLIKQPGRR